MRGFDEDVWNRGELLDIWICNRCLHERIVKYGVVLRSIRLKFTQSELASELKPRLLATGDTFLAKASYNTTWGVGVCNNKALNMYNGGKDWHGHNLLGEAIMGMRTKLIRAEEENRENEMDVDPESTVVEELWFLRETGLIYPLSNGNNHVT